MDLGIEGKVAMVAAASKGIGLATARALAQEGCRVSICARDEAVLEAAAGAISDETRSYVVDVSDAEDLAWWYEQTRQDLGPVSILVTNTGGPPAGSLSEMTDEQWKSGIDSTLMNIIRLVRLVQPDMQAAQWGRIAHLTSFVAKQPSPMLPISSTLRAGIMAMTRLQATELGPFGITVNGILPGHTLTDRQRHLADLRAERNQTSQDAELVATAQEIPVGRIADPEEIASVIAFLCSERASYVSGTSLLVDGGLTSVLG